MTPAPTPGNAPGNAPGNGNDSRESDTPYGANHSAYERLLDLLADRVLLGELSPADTQAMNTLLAEHPELSLEDVDGLEEAAALLAVSELARVPDSAVPAGLHEKLALDAEAFFAGPAPSAVEDAADFAAVLPASGASPVLAFIGGVLATAAVIALMLVLWPAQSRLPLGDR
ncbi:MAG: hypothetical protein AAGL98_04995, partial [Planctomycetota bacterium]